MGMATADSVCGPGGVRRHRKVFWGGIKAAELNEDALERYNRELLEQGMKDKAGRRAAIRAIYEGTGTWDMGEVDEMLDTYGYRTGGRVRHAAGDMVTADSEEVISKVPPAQVNQIQSDKLAEDAYTEILLKFYERFPGIATGNETIEEMVAMLQAEKVIKGTFTESSLYSFLYTLRRR